MKDNTIVKSIQQSQSLKLNPKLIHITTEGFVNDGFLDKELIKARKILHREDSGAAARRYLPWLYTQDSEEEIWRDENSWRKSNPSLGTIKRFEYLREQVDLAGQYRADRVFVLAKDFNIKQATATSWLDLEDYNYESYFDPEEFRGALCLGFVDLAMTTDLVVAKLMFMKPGDDNKYIVTRYFIPESKLIDSDDKGAGADYKQWAKEGHIQICEGNDVDVALVADWFYKLYKKYKFRLYKCGYDQKFSMEFRKKMDDYGFDYEVVMQNAVTLTNAYKILEGDLKARRTIYSSNPVDRWCLGNAAIKLVGDLGHFLVVKKDNPEERIDGAVAFGGLYEMYRRYRNEVFPKRK
jgi:phage terminase large subunit-like protein